MRRVIGRVHVRGRLSLAALTLLLLAVAVGPTLAFTWNAQTVDGTAGTLGQHTSIALDSNGRPHISYYDAGGGTQDLEYTYWNGTSWVTTTPDSAGNVGKFTSLALDNSNLPHISYRDDTNGDLKYAHFDGAVWEVETVDGAAEDVGENTSLALDSNGEPHIAYRDTTNFAVKYAAFDGTQWVITPVVTSAAVPQTALQDISLALDSNNRPHISYRDTSSNDLKYAFYDGAAWQFQTVETTGNVGQHSSLELDSNDRGHISYKDVTNGDLRYAYWDGAAWQKGPVDSTTDNVGEYSSLALDSTGKPRISYYDATNADLKYAYWDGSAWQNEPVDSADLVGQYTSLALDAGDAPHISYFQATGNNLRYATIATPPPTGSIKVTKAINGVGYPADPAFTVCVSGGSIGATPDCKVVTGDGGAATWSGLTPGNDYTVSENDAGADWTEPADQTGIAVTANATTDVTVTNTYTGQPPTTGTIRVTKAINGVGYPANPEFTICVSGGPDNMTVNCHVLTGDGATAEWTGLTAGGGYTVSEMDAGADWTEPADQTNVTVTANATTDVTVTNTYTGQPPTTGSIQVTKAINGTGYPANPQFTICVSGGSIGATPDCKLVTGAGGAATWSNLTPGNGYTVSENDAGTSWTEPADQTGVVVTANATTDVTVTNTYNPPPPVTGSIKVTKAINGTGYPANPQFTICVSGGSIGATPDCKLVTGDGGTATWSNLTPGNTYVVSENDAGASWTEPAAQTGVVVAANATTDVTVTNTYTPAPPATTLYMSSTARGTTTNGVAYRSEDILKWNGSSWSLWFDGSAAGLATPRMPHNINAFFIPEAGDEVLMAFKENRRVVPGIVDKVDGTDIVRWNGAFSLYFDGQDVELNVVGAERVDGLHRLDPALAPAAVKTAAGGSCQAYLLISTLGAGRVTNYDGALLPFRGEDVLGFCATSLGTTTAGKWHMLLDGSTQGMKPNVTDSISASPDGQTLYLTTVGAFKVDTAKGSHSMVYRYDFATQQFSGPHFSAKPNGLKTKVDGLQVNGALP